MRWFLLSDIEGPGKVNFSEIDNSGKGESMLKTAEPEETFY